MSLIPVDERLLILIRPALERALEVARIGVDAEPSVAPPKGLQPYLRFAKLPRAALAATRRVLDEDDAFRLRVVAATDEYSIGLACWLYLSRPDGWETDLKELAATYHADPVVADKRAQGEARRFARQQQAEAEARLRLEERANRAEDETARLRSELTEVRRQVRELTASQASAAERAASLESDRSQLLARTKDAEAKLTERAAEARQARREIDELRAALAATEARVAAAEAGALAAPGSAPAVAAAPVGPDHGADMVRASHAVGAAAEAAARLAEALGAVASSLLPTVAEAVDHGAAAVPDRTRPRRSPPRLGSGLVEDSAAAAAYLARLAGVKFLVDGYNVSKTGWPELELPEQRLRLVNALCELHLRHGTQVEVVFDGVDQDARLHTRALPPGVQVRFSPEEREADDVVLDRIGCCPPAAPVVVVSSDRRVQTGARSRGAAVLSSATLLALLR